MKKTMISMAVALASLIALPAVAQTQTQSGEPQQTEQTCSKDKKECKKEKKNKKKGDKKKGDKKKCNKQNCDQNKSAKRDKKGPNGFMRGIELTPAQQQKVDKLNDNRRNDMAKVREQSEKKMSDINKDYEKDLAKILTPEQMAQYKANQEKAPKMRDGNKGPKGPKGNKGMKADGRKFRNSQAGRDQRCPANAQPQNVSAPAK